MGSLTRGHWGIFPVSETLRQAEGKPEDPLQALALPACGNPLLPGWEDPEAEGGYQMLRNHLSNPPAAFLLGLACGHRGCLRTSGTAPWFVAFCAVIVFYPESQGAHLAPTSQAQRAFKPWFAPALQSEEAPAPLLLLLACFSGTINRDITSAAANK